MAADNNFTVTGNLTGEPELRFTPSGRAVAEFGVAVNRRWFNKARNDWDEEVSFFDVKAWGPLGENVAESVSKGQRVTVVGRLDQQRWEDDNGNKRSRVLLFAEDVAASLRFGRVEFTPNDVRTNKGFEPGKGKTDPPYNPDEEPF